MGNTDYSSLAAGPPVPQAVRFASVNQEIEPAHSAQSLSLTAEPVASNSQPLPPPEREIGHLALGLHRSHLHQRSMSNFAFEPCSLPASRVPSNESTPYQSSREQTRSDEPSPKISASASATTTPPLTPHGTHLEGRKMDDAVGASLAKVDAEDTRKPIPTPISRFTPSTTGEASSSSISVSRPSTDPTTLSQESSADQNRSRKEIGFTIGPSGSSSSASRSRGTSPSGTQVEERPGISTPPAGPPRPHTPGGDRDDPYARSRRPLQSKNLDSIDARFKFDPKDGRRRSPINLNASAPSLTSLPRSTGAKEEHRKSTFSLRSGKDHRSHTEKPHGSMSDLKRFFGIGSHTHKPKSSSSPAASARASVDKSGARTPPRHPSTAVPFADDHGLEKKYGKFGKILGSGAGGSVRLLKRSSDGRTFAVKQFRDRHNYETPRDYNKKVTAEFCIGSTLHHGNIIETLDIVQEGGHWFEVMEFAPFDLFAIVMTGKMSREEITCCFLQIVSGVAFLHGSGLAHRDLKLDNVVVNEHGIMKIIDFGSASVFKYPFENDIVLASGVVGSDPYLAPEVYDERRYDPQPADIWSLAIIFACMSLRRFPWKAPRSSDNSFKMFIAEPHTIPEDVASKERARSVATTPEAVGNDSRGSEPPQSHHHHHHHHHRSPSEKEGDGIQAKQEASSHDSVVSVNNKAETAKAEVIKGPWRLLRLLPRETRPILDDMLKLDPKKRATLSDIFADPWINKAPVCQQLEHGKILRAGTHKHVLEPGAPAPSPAGKSQ